MDDLARSEYPALLANLQPNQAVQVLNDRIKRINKINIEVAEWLQERRKVEDQYIQGLRRLAQYKTPNAASELGVFQAPWDKIIQSIDAIADCHNDFSTRLERDVESPLRHFHMRKEMLNMQTITANLTSTARDLEDAREKSEKLSRKGGKANTQKVDTASAKLDAASSQWESQAPFIFESLQMVDELRINQMRDIFTQWQTHESDQAQRKETIAAETLAAVIEIDTSQEISNFVARTTAGRPVLEKRTTSMARQSTMGSSLSASQPPPSSAGPREDNASEHSGGGHADKSESRLRSRIGTMLGRRRQSIHGGFKGLSPDKIADPFSRKTTSSHGRPGISPRPSFNNLAERSNRLGSVAESPSTPTSPKDTSKDPHEGVNGTTAAETSTITGASNPAPEAVNGDSVDVADVPPPAGPPPSQAKAAPASQPTKDAEGFTIPPAANDPISQAQREAAEEGDQLLKLNIQSSPVEQEDPDAQKAAMSNVANTLTQMAAPSRKTGTVRGRRDVRNTIYVPPPSIGETPSPLAESQPSSQPASESAMPQPASSIRSPVAALASEASVAATSDSQSVRSATSLGALPHVKHPEMSGPGLNASIIETVSATFEEGVVKNAKVSGEIAFSHNSSEAAASESKETIKINNFANLEVIGPNRIFVHNESPDQPDVFSLDVSHIGKTATGFTYRVHSDDSDGTPGLAEYAPLLVRPAWKPQGDKLGLLLQYCLNPASPLTAPVTLHNVVFVATYEGGRAAGVQTKPSGTHLRDKHLVYWRLGDVVLGADVHKIVCRVLGAEGAELKPGTVEARWEYAGGVDGAFASGISVSRLEETKGKGKDVEAESESDPFADENPTSPALAADQRWAEVPLVRRLVGGKYEAR